MKIIICNNLYTTIRGGAERIARQMASDLAKEDNEIIIITTKNEKGTTIKQANVYSIFSNYDKLNKKNNIYKFFWHLRDILPNKNRKIIKEIINQEQPDKIITHNLMGLGLEIARIARTKKIVHEHILHDIQLIHPSGLMYYNQEQITETIPAKIYQAITKSMISSPNIIISPSKWLLALHKQKGFFKNSETRVIPNKISTKEMTRQKQPNNIPTCIYVGLIEKHKGIEILLEAFKELPKINLEIIGAGSLTDKLKTKYQSQANIHWHGFLEPNIVDQQLFQADLCIVPSLCYENYPTIIVQANQLNTRVIGSDLGGIKELITDNTKLFRPNDIDDLRAKIIDNLH